MDFPAIMSAFVALILVFLGAFIILPAIGSATGQSVIIFVVLLLAIGAAIIIGLIISAASPVSRRG